MSNSLPPHGMQHARLSFIISQTLLKPLSIELEMLSNDIILCCPLLFLPSITASGSFPMSQLFAPGGQSIGASASVSVLLKTIQSWFPLGLTGLISLQSKEPKVSLFLGLFQELSIIYFLLMQVCDMPVPCLHFFFHVDPKSFLKQRNKVKTETLPQVGGSRNLTEV